jgi:hypothetical protein
LGFLGKLARFFNLFVLLSDAFTINASFDNQVERVRRETEFLLRNRQSSLGSLHNSQV